MTEAIIAEPAEEGGAGMPAMPDMGGMGGMMAERPGRAPDGMADQVVRQAPPAAGICLSRLWPQKEPQGNRGSFVVRHREPEPQDSSRSEKRAPCGGNPDLDEIRTSGTSPAVRLSRRGKERPAWLPDGPRAIRGPWCRASRPSRPASVPLPARVGKSVLADQFVDRGQPEVDQLERDADHRAGAAIRKQADQL